MINQARLVIEGRSNWVRTHHIGAAELVTIGRGAENTIDTQDPHTSTRHAEIFLKDGHHYLRDLGSLNGTLLNGAKIKEVLLRNGAAIQVGQTTMSFLTDDDVSMAGLGGAVVAKPKGLATPESALDAVDTAIEKLKKTQPITAPSKETTAALRIALEDLQRELRQARSEVRRLRTANEFTLTLATKGTPYEKLELAMAFIAERVRAENGFLMQVDPVGGKWVVRARHGAISDWQKGEGAPERLPLSLTLVEGAISGGGKGLHSPSAIKDERFENAESVKLLGIQSCLCAPIKDRQGRPAGACYVDRRTSDKPFDSEDRGAFESMVEQLGHMLYPRA